MSSQDKKLEKRDEMRRYYKKYPWARTLANIRSRKNSKAVSSYENYKDIEVSITLSDLKFLWFRDKAYKMKRHSIDRIDNTKGYSLKNCRYLELSENISRGNLGRKTSPLQSETARQNLKKTPNHRRKNERK